MNRPTIQTTAQGLNEPMPAVQVRAIRAMSFGKRLAVGMGFIRAGRRLKRAALRQQHPDWTDAEIANEMRRLTINGRT
jgi:Rv0078B-related antitoxin